jgi:Tfp pilus assembly protein PilF
MNDAMESFNRALRADPNQGRAYLGIGKIYAAHGKTEVAMENYTKALSLEKDPHAKNSIMNELYMEGTTWDT